MWLKKGTPGVWHNKYFTIFCRSEYLYHEMVQLASHFQNVEVANWREAPIWGGTSLLTTIFNGLRDLIQSAIVLSFENIF